MDTMQFKWLQMEYFRKLESLAEKQIQRFCSDNNVTVLQMGLLVTVYYSGSQTVSGLARRTSMADANNSAMCKKLEKMKLLTRRRGSTDERQVFVSLTDRGIALVEQLKKNSEERGLFADFSEKEREDVLAVMERLVTYYETEAESRGREE